MKLSAKIGQNFFSTQNNLQSVSDDNIDPWKRFLTEKAPLGTFCKKAPKSWRLMNVLFKKFDFCKGIPLEKSNFLKW